MQIRSSFLVKFVFTPFTFKLYDFNKVGNKFEYLSGIQVTKALKVEREQLMLLLSAVQSRVEKVATRGALHPLG